MPTSLSASAFRRVRDTVRRVEQQPLGQAPERARVINDPIEIHHGKVTSATTTDGRYRGLRWQRTFGATTPTYTASTDPVCWIEPPNGEPLVVGTLYPLKLVDVHTDGKIVYQAIIPPPAFSGAAVYNDATAFSIGPIGSVPVNGYLTFAAAHYDTGSIPYWGGVGDATLRIPETGKYLLTGMADPYFTGGTPGAGSHAGVYWEANGRLYGQQVPIEGMGQVRLNPTAVVSLGASAEVALKVFLFTTAFSGISLSVDECSAQITKVG